ncbi:tetratricopeptide repeat protein [Ruegeria sp. 6PALISEP08]|uniref:tetratricopeptide repeat protein n=1 Tax=Ruegeria sp. 6PALISEP08 TaxID=1225660 RepID=UPI00067F56CA|nr:hypothetical protein [Ruegeria sp. 6PALISEP08]
MGIRLAALIVVCTALLLSFNTPSKAEREYARLRAACGMGCGSEMAIPACTALLDLNDEPLEARQDYYAKRAQALHSRRHYQQAIEDADRALSLNPQDAVTLIWRGYSKNALEDKDGARADLERAQKISPNSTYVLFNVAKKMRTWGEVPLALEGYEKVLELDPSFEDAGTRYLTLLYDTMPTEAFERHLAQAEAKWPDQPWAHDARVTYELRYSYDLEKALNAIEKRISIAPNPSADLLLFALIHMKIGDEKKGIEYAEAYAKAENKIQWRDKGSVRKTIDLLLGYVIHGQGTEWIMRSHTFAALGAADLARAEYLTFLENGGPYSPKLLLDIIERAGVPVDPQARAGSTAHINKAIDDHIHHLEQKVGFSNLGP